MIHILPWPRPPCCTNQPTIVMTLKKHQSTAALLIGSLLMIMSCDENSTVPNSDKLKTTSQSKATTNARIANYSFDGTEGGEITLDVAARWIGNYANQNLGRITAHFVGRKALEKMLSKTGSMGIRFYYSLDDAGNPIVFATGADGKGQDFSSDYRVKGKNSSFQLDVKATAFTLTESDADSMEIPAAKHWIDNYNLGNPTGVQAHFFGYQIIKQILSENGCVGLRCYYALNDAGIQQLLLIGVTSTGQNILPLSSFGGRTEDDGTIADLSYICPTHCSGG